ncbi:MAG: integrase arm-type DNA-binding domain-containing protein, partial [Motiliproteus sp.]
MARKTNPLTNTEVKQAKPRDKEYSLVDGEGLSLRIKPTGSKTWVFNYYRPHSKKRANISFGIYPDVSLAKARERRRDARQLIAEDIDPKLHREEKQRQQQNENSKTLAHVVEQWFAIKQIQITPSYADDIIRSLRNHVLPKLGKWPLHQISAPVVIDALQPLAKSGKLEAVKRVTQR